MRLAIVTTHPIQYYAPVFKLLAQQIDVKVFYTWGEASLAKHDPGFGKTIKWDINFLEGYDYQWETNTAAQPGSHHFNGIINPTIIADIEAWKPDTLLVYGWAYKSHLQVLRHFKNKIPVLFRGDSTLLDKPAGFKNSIRTIYLKWVYKHIDYALYTGTNNKAYYTKYGLKNSQLVFAPHAVDNDRFDNPHFVEASELRSSLNIKNEEILILYAGKFDRVKNIGALLSAFISLNHADVHLLLVGNGVNEVELKAEAAQSHIACNIHFMDFKNQSFMPVVYQAADLFCLPSISETWGLGVNEAMACGKAILVSDKAGCAIDLVKPDFNGFIHTAGSVADIAEKLNTLLAKGKTGLAQMGEHSKQIICSWDFQTQANAIVNYKNGRNQ
jgi:glycosyltransferase involved in cell wall biosynthesis